MFNNRRHSLFVTLLFVSITATSALPFDGQRKGFVLGGGLGFAPVMKWSADAASGEKLYGFDESKAGMAAHFVIGYAPSNSTMLVYLGNSTANNSTLLRRNQVVQGVNALGFYKYFGRSKRQFFATAAAGLYGFDASDAGMARSRFGWLIGFGNEFSRHWQVGLYFASGTTSADHAVNGMHLLHLSLIFSVLAY